MKLCNILVDGACHLACDTATGLKDLTAAGFSLTMDEVIARNAADEAVSFLKPDLPSVADPVFANVVNNPGKIVCVGLNYRKHAENAHMKTYDAPALFSKFSDALVPAGTAVELPPWETTYDYEAELVIVMGKTAWGVAEEDAMDCIYGYTCGNDLSCRDSQKRSGQWLIGKTMPGFAPVGPVIVPREDFDAFQPHFVRSYVNGEVRQNGNVSDLIFDCAKIVSYVSKYVRLEPGDLIFTGTPSGTAMEYKDEEHWLKPGDVVEIEIEGIGTLRNTMK
jgi:2-keto-4-pentenoate hydratase/2-oxohepta-3-ene-1,7-dioic acid hydratase in catechol pathway